jgi:hypothetical protein
MQGGKNKEGQREPPAQLLPRMVDEMISYFGSSPKRVGDFGHF